MLEIKILNYKNMKVLIFFFIFIAKGFDSVVPLYCTCLKNVKQIS